MFQDVIASAISEIPNGKKISDDVIIYGVNRKEHKTLHAVLTRDKKLNLSLRKDINFFGLVFSGRGMSPDPAKIEATQKADPLSSVIDVRSLSGWPIICLALFVIMQKSLPPLRELTHNSFIQMREVHQTVVDRLKNSPTSDDVMAYFDPRKKTVLLVDASPVGLGAVLTQDGKVNSYGSKAHSSVEKRYS